VVGLETSIRQLAVHYLDEVRASGSFDFIKDFAGQLPMDVISEMLGVPREDRDMLRGWADTVVHREEGKPDIPPAGMEAAANMIHYFAKHVARRRSEPGEDLTAALIAAEIDGDRLNDKEIMAFLFLMVIAGNETTTKLLGNALYWLWRHPEQRARVNGDPSVIPNWVEETLRFDNSTQMLARTLTCDVELHGKTMRKGDKVALLVGAANRDERVFRDPDAYDVARDCRQSLSFGYGTHFCLGASLARLEARVSLEELMARFADYEIDPVGLVRVHSSNVRGFSAIPIHFDR
jgi:cytochrome P450